MNVEKGGNAIIQSNGKGRNLNIEILRIVAMLMVVIGHTLGHSNAVNEANGLMGVILNVVFIMIIPAVNIYVLISGYFLINAKWDFKRILLLWLQVFFYSVLLYLVALATGITQFSFSGFLKAFMPISANQYWFARVFWAFSLFAPFVAILLNKLSKKQYQLLLAITLIIFSLWRSFIPFATTVNIEGGNSILWFFVLFAIAGYLRLHTDFKRKNFWLILFIFSSILSVSSHFVLSFISNYLGLGGKGTGLFTEYTSITMIGMSVGLFMFFASLPEKNFSKNIGKAIMLFSSSTYSVYLIHENIYVKKWLFNLVDPAKWVDTYKFFLYDAIFVAAIFLLCILIDTLLWKQISKLIKSIDFSFIQNKIDILMK